jgi:receptor expression-enhancing protein 1/2/3/4
MLMSLLSHILIGYFCFALPSFATFKALSHRPLSEPELQRWATYWSVVGAFTAVEYALEWFISWLPFYWEVKTGFLMFLALPQTEGSTYIYETYLRPFYTQNEADLDSGILTVQKNTLNFIQARIGSLLDIFWNLLNKNSAAQSQGQPPAESGNPLGPALNLWKTYSSSVMNTAQPRSDAANLQNRTLQPSPLPTPHEPIGTPFEGATFAPAFPEPQHE